ncbi:dehydrogenase with different specificitie [Macrophomina phaseolina]|uniref:Dehydrogenase with different specificitie n=1 Tax=Macrophomina phaseolina TaxID=35725 RepID=A0ABQ8FR67_9PEZI|nr:dehydrogenase with different specificitie [Macrophomina phaseolina]
MTSTAQHLTLAGKVAIVTGGSRGIGASIALELAKRGAKVAVTFVSPSSEKLADQVVSTINDLGNGAFAIKIQADMRNLESPKKIVSETITAFGNSIDILVNNAGIAVGKPLGEITVEGYAEVMDVNLRSVIFMTQAVLPYLRSPGRIISIGSVMGRVGFPQGSLYSASKVALEALSRGWASELGAASHTVNVVAPALTETDMMAHAPGTGSADRSVQMQKMMTPLEHRLGKPEDIALVTAMLAEPSSRWITGQTIQAGGGIYMS